MLEGIGGVSMNYYGVFNQIFVVTGPVFAMVFLGIVLRYFKLIDQPFIETSSRLIFKGTMPTLFFLSIWKADLQQALVPELLIATGLGTGLAFGLSWWWAARTLQPIQRGVFVQGSFRGNCGVVSLALVISYFGDYGLAVGGVLAGFTILLFNTLSVFILALYSPSFDFSGRAVVKELASNPLILSVLAGLSASWVQLQIPEWIQTSAGYFAQLTLPLALICIGGTLSLEGLKHSGKPAVHSTAIKLLIAPFMSCVVAWVFGVKGQELIVLWMYLASPTAAASFAMALAAGGDGRLAANIIALTTVVSLFTITGGIFILRALGH